MESSFRSEIYRVHESRLDDLKARVEKFDRKAHKLGKMPLIVRYLDTETEVDEKTGRVHVFTLVEVSGLVMVLNGWTFVAKLDHTLDGEMNMLRVVPGMELPAHYRKAGSNCDHCERPIFRNMTYVLKNESGEYKQVGKTCIRDFIGVDPEHAIGYIESWGKLADDLDGMDGEEGGYGRGGRYIEKFDLLKYLSYVSMVIESDGHYVSRAKASERYEADGTPCPTTSDLAWNYMTNTLLKNPPVPTAKNMEEAEKVLAWVKETLLSKDEDTLSDYEYNSTLVLKTEAVTYKTDGIAASFFPMYHRAMTKLEEAKLRKPSEHVGEVGKRMDFTLTCFYETGFDSQFGYTSIFLMKDENDNVFKWKTGTGASGLEKGATVKIKATIKEHDEYKGTKQTVLTRCKILEVIKPEGEAAAATA